MNQYMLNSNRKLIYIVSQTIRNFRIKIFQVIISDQPYTRLPVALKQIIKTSTPSTLAPSSTSFFSWPALRARELAPDSDLPVNPVTGQVQGPRVISAPTGSKIGVVFVVFVCGVAEVDGAGVERPNSDVGRVRIEDARDVRG